MGREISISVMAEGWFKETIELNDDCTLTDAEILEKLNKGELVTTIQENGFLDITATGESIGKILDVNNELEYHHFS